MLHRLDDEATHAGDALFQNASLAQLPTIRCLQPGVKFAPDVLIGPFGDIFVGRDLKIESSDLRRTHAVKGETALVVRVDQFVVRRRSLGKNA